MKAANFDARAVRPEHADLRLDVGEPDLINAADLPIQDIRLEKVEALRRAIAEGRYHVSARQIAAAMIRDRIF